MSEMLDKHLSKMSGDIFHKVAGRYQQLNRIADIVLKNEDDEAEIGRLVKHEFGL